jgi:peptidoglycan/LPS O-acetylase OafA/YrhL
MSSVPVGHVHALDGVRGLAIALVLLYHGWMFKLVPDADALGTAIDSVRQVGWAGVDVFFVLSGYLITGILCDSKDRPDFWRSFWIRRSLRVFPIYYIVLLAILVAGMVSPAFRHEGLSQIWVNFLYLTNFWVGFRGEDVVPFDSAWSLALEEQFYLVFPFLVRLCSRRALTFALIAIAVAAPVFRILTWHYGSQRVFGPYALPYCRMDALAIGALLRLAISDATKMSIVNAASRSMPIVCTLAFCFLVVTQRKDAQFIAVGYTLTAVAAATLIARLISSPPRAWGRRFFEGRALSYLGKISYGVYLFHLLVRVVLIKLLAKVFAPEDINGTVYCAVLLFAMTGITLIVATVSFRLIEKPILTLKDRWAPVKR